MHPPVRAAVVTRGPITATTWFVAILGKALITQFFKCTKYINNPNDPSRIQNYFLSSPFFPYTQSKKKRNNA